MKKYLFAILIYLTASFPAFAETSLWKVEAGGSVTYLGGTCHVLRDSDYPLPAEFEKAYRDSAVVAFETNLNKMNDPAVLNTLLQEGTYSDGRTLETTLSPRAYDALKQYCEGAGIPMAAIRPMKPWMALLSLLSVELKKLGVSDNGVDMYFFKKALAEGKTIDALEAIDKHIGFISLMGKGYENQFVLYSVDDLKETREIVDELIAMWKKGDDAKLRDVFADQMKKECPALYDLILVKRNHDWLPKIEKFLQTPQTELVLVGVAHLVGKDGLLSLLEKRGYRVSRVHGMQ